MALHALLDITLAVPRPQELFDFWVRRGLRVTADGVLGTADRPVQLRITEGTHRHLAELHLGCASERDLADIADRLDRLGVTSTLEGTTLSCTDPVLGHRVVIDVAPASPLSVVGDRVTNRPGTADRRDTRAEAVLEIADRAPRRVGHVVLGTPKIAETTAFYIDGLGYRISDQILRGAATFARVERDHHNLLIHPAPCGHLNHYALEMDDIDAIGRAGSSVLAERPDASVVGVGRHNLGSNLFWYMRDPAGNMFEFFADMDQIVDDAAWDRDHGRRDWEGADGPAGFSVWGPKEPREFFAQPDLREIAEARRAMGLV